MTTTDQLIHGMRILMTIKITIITEDRNSNVKETKRRGADGRKRENAEKRRECEGGLYVEVSGIRKREKRDHALSRKERNDGNVNDISYSSHSPVLSIRNYIGRSRLSRTLETKLSLNSIQLLN